MQNEITLNPVGYLQSELKQRYETPRQGVLAKENKAIVYLNPNQNFEQAVKDLSGFERIWIIYQFHLNKNWKPLVSPPRHTRKKVGVFATRAPYRPNHIGLSCVKLEKVDGLKIHISESDILDGTPIFDIKPYLPYSDSFPNVRTGWVKSGLENIYKVNFNLKAKKYCEKLRKEKDINLLDYSRVQLEFYPTDITRKRISRDSQKNNEKNHLILTYQKWNIYYTVFESEKTIIVTNIK